MSRRVRRVRCVVCRRGFVTASGTSVRCDRCIRDGRYRCRDCGGAFTSLHARAYYCGLCKGKRLKLTSAARREWKRMHDAGEPADPTPATPVQRAKRGALRWMLGHEVTL